MNQLSNLRNMNYNLSEKSYKFMFCYFILNIPMTILSVHWLHCVFVLNKKKHSELQKRPFRSTNNTTDYDTVMMCPFKSRRCFLYYTLCIKISAYQVKTTFSKSILMNNVMVIHNIWPLGRMKWLAYTFLNYKYVLRWVNLVSITTKIIVTNCIQ